MQYFGKKEMGKNLRQKGSIISLRSNENEGGHAWGLLHIIKYHHWRRVKKKLTQKNPSLVENHEEMPSSNPNKQEQDDGHMYKPTVEERSRDSSPRKNNSVKSRIKSFLAEEITHKKGRHHRSSSCPVRQLTRTDSIHHSQLPYLEPLIKTLELDYEQNIEIHSASNEQNPMAMNSDSSQECSVRVVEDEPQHDHFDESPKLLQGELENTTAFMLKQKSTNERKCSVDALASHPKECLDALDIISVNKELVMKILQDPGSPLAHHFSSQQALSAKQGLDKCKTFPSSGSLGYRGLEPSRLKHMKKASPASAKQQKNNGDTHAVVKHFKTLKQKIKHVIREGRKERHIISMDAIIHKIPHGHNMEEEIDNKLNSSANYEECKDIDGTAFETDLSSSSLKKNKARLRHQMRRASSLTESLDRYCQLYETSFNREAKHQNTEGLKIKIKEEGSPNSVPKYLARIYSLPDLNSFLDPEESPEALSSSKGQANNVMDQNVSTSSYDEPKDLGVAVGIAGQLHMNDDHTTKSIISKSSVETGAVNFVTDDELGLTSISNSEADTQLCSHIHDYGSLTVEESENEAILADELVKLVKDKELDMATPQVSGTEKAQETLDKQIMEEISHLKVNSKDKAEFSYVRDVLELSGFSSNAFLGTWHSDDQPVDPSVYEEVEGCLEVDPNTCANEDFESDHMLLFDIINEVLIEIYARSYSYCPFPLSCVSLMSPMPAGPHVLREVWSLISWYLSFKPEVGQSLDYVVGRDLAKSHGWMNLQFDSECVGLELEDLIFEDLLEEAILGFDIVSP
ncbi:hypothetical protein CsatA_022942 [Cannabis sativa]